MRGFAVIDFETTGPPGYRHRIIEIGVVHLDTDGVITDRWSTLLNPDRDLGPRSIHGITAAEVRRAPRFSDVAGELVELLRGRVLVAHNWSFEAAYLRSEFRRIGCLVPVTTRSGLCTMRAAGRVFPTSSRSLRHCREAVGLRVEWAQHTALGDAVAAAELFQRLRALAPHAVAVGREQMELTSASWPSLPRLGVAPVGRRTRDSSEPHFLARLTERMPRADDQDIDSYLEVLDRALLDLYLSHVEADDLVAHAQELGLSRSHVVAAHETYLRDLAREAWADGTVTQEEREDLHAVAKLLDLSPHIVDDVLDQEKGRSSSATRWATKPGVGLVLEAGDRVVFTGEMGLPREELEERARKAGLSVTSAVSRKTRVVVAGDPDSLSTKAKTARKLGVPIVHEKAFIRALERLENG